MRTAVLSSVARSPRWLRAVLSFALLAACSSDNTPAAPSGPVIVSISDGDAQIATVGQAVSIAPAVRVTRNGAVVSAAAVTFSVQSGGGSVTGATTVSDANGIARAGAWTLGTTAGANILSAAVTGGGTTAFNATGRPGNPAALAKLSGDGQTAVVGDAVPTRPSVRVNDQFGNAVAGAVVSYAVTQGGGTIAGATTVTATTGADGSATVSAWTLGTVPGANTLTATVTGIPSATFTVTARVGPAALASKVAGDAQIGTVGQALTIRPALKVTDVFGNGIAGVVVTFAAVTGGGAITGATQPTGADGVATLGGWTLGTLTGANTITAAVGGTNIGATFGATANAGPATTVTKVAGDLQTVASGTAVLAAPAVKVADQFGNGIAGVSVRFSVVQGGGTVSTPAVNTGADGIARAGGWTVGTTSGLNTVSAAVSGVGLTGNPAIFSATGITGPAAILAKVTGDNQVSVPGGFLNIPLSVRLSDQFGNAVSGRTVLFAIGSGGGTLSGVTPFTTLDGTAILGSWTLGPAAGQQSVTASVGSLNVVFTATAFASLNPALYAGTYTGTWINTTFGSTDVASATIIINAATSSASVTASAGGSVLGGGAVGPTTRSATYSSTTATFTGNVPEMGNITGTIVNSSVAGVANIQATGTNVPNTAILRWTATGTISATQLFLNFTVFFTSGSTAVGSVTLNKP